jgi:hypothetical protein
VGGGLTVFFGFQPTFDAVVMNELNTSSTLTDLEQGIGLIIVAVPAQAALSNVVIIVLDHSCILSFLLRFFRRCWTSRGLTVVYYVFLLNFLWLVWLNDLRQFRSPWGSRFLNVDGKAWLIWEYKIHLIVSNLFILFFLPVLLKFLFPYFWAPALVAVLADTARTTS